MRMLLLLLLAAAPALGQTTSVRIYSLNASVTVTWAGDGANNVIVGDYTWTANTADFNALGWQFDHSGGSSSPDLRSYLSQFGFLEGAYVFTLDDDGAGNFTLALESEPAPPPPPPEATLWDWWQAGWALGLTVCGWGLLLRVVKGLRGPGSGEI